MPISMHDLPMDDSGVLPAGMWKVVLRDNLTDGFSGCIFERGVSVLPINGRALVRLVVGMPVIGALRVEGGPFAVGDVSKLGTASGRAPADHPVDAADPATPPAASDSAQPKTMAELEALTDERLRKLGAELGAEAGWKILRLRRYVARELDIEGA